MDEAAATEHDAEETRPESIEETHVQPMQEPTVDEPSAEDTEALGSPSETVGEPVAPQPPDEAIAAADPGAPTDDSDAPDVDASAPADIGREDDDRASSLAAVASALETEPGEGAEPRSEASSLDANDEPVVFTVDPSAEPLVGSRPPRTLAPYATYALAWIILSAVTYVVLRDVADPLDSDSYLTLVTLGVGLTAASPIIALWAWLSARSRRSPEDRHGLLAKALLMAAALAAFGVAVWWGALLAVDAARGAL